MTSANQTPRIITITTPGPQGIQGPPGYASSGSNTYLGDQIITGSILISGSIVPDIGTGELTSSFSLGSPEAAWKDIYVSNGSIKFVSSGSTAVTLSAQNGGISVNGGSTITANGVSGQFVTSKSLDIDTTVKDYNNSLLMGPIDIETDKEIVVEEGSDLTIFGDIENTTPDNLSVHTLNVNSNTILNGELAVSNNIDAFGKVNSLFYTTDKTISSDVVISNNESALIIGNIVNIEEEKELIIEDESDLTIFGDIETQNPTIVDNALFATSASYADASSYAVSASYIDTASYATTASYSNTASYALNISSPFPYNGEAQINGRLLVNNYTPVTILDTYVGMLYSEVDNNTSIDWFNRLLHDDTGQTTVDWQRNKLTDSTGIKSIDWDNRILVDNSDNTIIDYSTSSSVLINGGFDITNPSIDAEASGSISAGGANLTIAKYSTFTTSNAGGLTFQGGNIKLSGSSMHLDVPAGVYNFTSASANIINSTPSNVSNVNVAFAQTGSNFYIYVYIGGRWRSASLS